MAGLAKSVAKTAGDAGKNQYRKDFDRGTTAESPEVQMARCADLEEAVEVLRVHYEHYFLGLVRKEPNKERDLLKTEVLRLKSSFLRNTGVKFRVASLHNKFLSYERMWQRTVREIEEGTYHRDLFKARMHKKVDPEREAEAAATEQKLEDLTRKIAEADARAEAKLAAQRKAAAEEMPNPDRTMGPGSRVGAPAASASDDFDLDVDEEPMEERAPAPPPRPIAAPRPMARPAPLAARAGSAGGLTDDKVKAIYDAYLMAKRRCKESTTGLTFESLSATLRKQMPTLMDKHKAKAIDFKVVIKGGKAILKAVPK